MDYKLERCHNGNDFRLDLPKTGAFYATNESFKLWFNSRDSNSMKNCIIYTSGNMITRLKYKTKSKIKIHP